MSHNYYPPVDKLLTAGECRIKDFGDYSEYGFTREHIPDLIRMAGDESLHRAESDSAEVYAPVHAWRVLGRLKAVEAVEPLLQLLHTYRDNDWVQEEIPLVMEKIGPAALPALRHYLAEPEHGDFPRAAAARGVSLTGSAYPDQRDECVEILTHQLQQFETNEKTLNAFLISYLVDLNASESAGTMEKAYAANRVDLTVLGDWEDAQIELGLLSERETPARNYLMEDLEEKSPETAKLMKEFINNLRKLGELQQQKEELEAQEAKLQAGERNRRKREKKARKKKGKGKKR
jgi:hypothetical protein